MEDIKEFCRTHINTLSQTAREHVFVILRSYIIDDNKIDSSNLDGSRVYESYISDECFNKMYEAIKNYLEA